MREASTGKFRDTFKPRFGCEEKKNVRRLSTGVSQRKEWLFLEGEEGARGMIRCDNMMFGGNWQDLSRLSRKYNSKVERRNQRSRQEPDIVGTDAL